MHSNRKWNLIVWVGLAATVGCTEPPRGPGDVTELRLASDVWPPFTDIPTKPRVALDLVLTGLSRAGVHVRTELRKDFISLVGLIRAGRLDGSAALWRTPERERFMLYSRPYLENRLILVGRRTSPMTATKFADLHGRRVAIVGSYAYGEAVEGAEGPQFVEGANDSENLRSLLRGEVDYVLADELLVHHLVQSDPEKAEQLLRIGKVPLVRRSLHFAIRRDYPGAESIVARFNQEIAEMLTDGTYNRILRVESIQVDVDGDGTPELVLAGRRARSTPERGYELFDRDSDDRQGQRYIIEGKTYESWEQVPPRYKTPREGTGNPEGPKEDASREWGLPLLGF